MCHPELLEKIADESLVNEAVRLQSERPFEEGDVWRKFCSAALQGLGLEASLSLWDRLAVLTYREQEPEVADTFGDDPLEQLNSPGAILAWSLFDALIATNPAAAVGLGPKFERRFDKILVADGRPGIHGRVYLIRYLPNLEWVDPAWTEVKLTPLLYWDQPEALAMWRFYSQAPQIGSPRLFNVLKPAMLNAFERSDLSDREFDGLISKMLAVGLWRRRGHALDYDLANREINRALTAGPPTVRKNASWNFRRTMGDEKGEPADKATRWRQIIGPFFRDIWPLDASLRNEEATRNLVMMALECEAAFPEAVIAILDLVVPYQLYQISHSLRLEPRHDQLVPQHPSRFKTIHRTERASNHGQTRWCLVSDFMDMSGGLCLPVEQPITSASRGASYARETTAMG